ncbi:DUF1488 domain-containing protein [Labrys wisconsinensis]|uniref:DUF1488 domain-containing protein n=1 Tax=Labrys wisconsinensis TaxID=425677 RepID=A0ABU0JKA5_9HYPH|nr:DUF1488 domain-containing protein [Labrys wisconsinensis]MDQ0474717.1 hypothetical protein [Labrys wisconsinensis]
MPLNFPNASRSYDAARQSVCFWGHDSAFEIAFYVGEDALRVISPQAQPGEVALLEAFDANRPRIQQAASRAYARRRQSFYHLTAPDF